MQKTKVLFQGNITFYAFCEYLLLIATQADIKPLSVDVGIQCDIGIQSDIHRYELPTSPSTPVIEPTSPEPEKEKDDLYEPPEINSNWRTE